jgi:hypothetical protein
MSDEGDAPSGLPANLDAAISTVDPTWKTRLAKFAIKIAGRTLGPDGMRAVMDDFQTIEGRSIVSNAMAHAVAAKLAADPEQVARAQARYWGDEARRQQNLESIISQTPTYLAALPAPDASIPSANSENELSEDWRAKFTSYAQDVSDAEMQQVWARVLAGEIASPGSFSYRTLRTVSELEPDIAEAFQSLQSRVFAGDSVYAPLGEFSKGDNFKIMSLLLESGLTRDRVNQSQKTLKPDEAGRYFLWGAKKAVFVRAPSGPREIVVPIIQLSRVGRELWKLMEQPDEAEVLRSIAEREFNPFDRKNSVAFIGRIVREGPMQRVTDDEWLWGDAGALRRLST